MTTSTSERWLPWTGAVAGLAWVGQATLFSTGGSSGPGAATSAAIQGSEIRNQVAAGCLVVMGVALAFFATALGDHLRRGGPRGAAMAGVAQSGVVLVAAGVGQMLMWTWGLVNGASEAGDDEALRILDFVAFFGFAGMSIGVATMLLATGAAGWRARTLPRWFAVVSLVLGTLSALGAAGVPPGGLVNYLLLPVWLVAMSVVLARGARTHRSAGPLGGPALRHR